MTADPSPSQPVTSLPPAPAASRSPAGLLWTLQTALLKKAIYWQDRLGLYPYSWWIRVVEKPALAYALEQSAGSALAPTINFVAAGGDFSLPALRRSLGSLPPSATAAASIFLLLPNPYMAQESWLRDLLVGDARLHILPVRAGEGAEAWIEALNALPGEWIVPLESGDVLAPEWLDLFRRFAGERGVDIIYWDEDELTGAGRRARPFFKPGWSPELLYALNYLESAAFRKDLLLRACQAVESTSEAVPGKLGWIFEAGSLARSVTHLPYLLQHRRPCPPETGRARLERHARGVQAHLRRRGRPGASAEVQENAVHPVWQAAAPLVSIIIPNHNNLGYLRRCLTSLFEKTDYPNYEILLMDDHSTDPRLLAYYQELQAQHANLRLHANEGTFNYSRVNNQGARLAKGELLLFLNNDVELISAGWLAELARWAQLPGVGMAGARLLYPDQSIQHAGIVVGLTGHAGHIYAGNPPAREGLFVSAGACRNVSAVTGACMLVRREVFERIGGFNEDFLLVFNDVEIGQRVLNSGQRVVYAPAATLIHYEGRSRARYIPAADIRLGAELLGETVRRGDPYYNPNLSLAVPWPSLRRAIEPAGERQLLNILRFKGK